MTTIKDLEISERDAGVIALLRDGLNQTAISEETGLSQATVSRILSKHVKALPAIITEEYRKTELLRLEARREQVAELINRAMDEDDRKTYLAAVATEIKISESIRKLLGADAPVKIEAGVSAHFTYEIKGVENL